MFDDMAGIPYSYPMDEQGCIMTPEQQITVWHQKYLELQRETRDAVLDERRRCLDVLADELANLTISSSMTVPAFAARVAERISQP